MPSWKKEMYVDASGAWRHPDDDYIDYSGSWRNAMMIMWTLQVHGGDRTKRTSMSLAPGDGREINM